MGKKVAKPDAPVAEIAGRQYGVVSLAQLRRLGFSQKMIGRRVAAARFHRVHRNVYAVGHSALSTEGRCLAAVLAVGRGPHDDAKGVLERWGAAVSHRSAAALWGLLPARQTASDVIVAGNAGRAPRDGIRVHRSLSLPTSDVTLRGGIPITTPARTIVDLRRAISIGRPGVVSSRELKKAIRQAGVIGLPIGDDAVADRTRSDLESDFLVICRRYGLPQPEVNVRIGPFLVDFLWREERLVVETDGYRYHRGRAAFQDDRSREVELTRLGYGVMHLAERQINAEGGRVAEALTVALTSRRGD